MARLSQPSPPSASAGTALGGGCGRQGETAVDAKIEEQLTFHAWWQASVQSAGQPKKNSPRTREMLSMREAEHLTGLANQRVSDLGKRLSNVERHRARLQAAESGLESRSLSE